jgi:hypothetical protein
MSHAFPKIDHCMDVRDSDDTRRTRPLADHPDYSEITEQSAKKDSPQPSTNILRRTEFDKQLTLSVMERVQVAPRGPRSRARFSRTKAGRRKRSRPRSPQWALGSPGRVMHRRSVASVRA